MLEEEEVDMAMRCMRLEGLRKLRLVSIGNLNVGLLLQEDLSSQSSSVSLS